MQHQYARNGEVIEAGGNVLQILDLQDVYMTVYFPTAVATKLELGSEARVIFDALGAQPWSDRAREELRAAGETSLRRTERIWEKLAPQELHIAQLAAQGLSNKAIAARLYLSHRTVGYYLHNVFSKTGVTSRSGLGPVLSTASSPAT